MLTKPRVYQNMSRYITIFLLFSVGSQLLAGDMMRVINLRGHWKFTIGDNQDWSSYAANDSDWDEIFVPSAWEDQGYNGYNGYAWYRKHFDLKDWPEDFQLYLQLGKIDDVDEVFINGVRLGQTGQFPPNYETGFHSERCYPLPQELLYEDKENVIAIRVYDSQIMGGIVWGDVGIYANRNEFSTEIDLRGDWVLRKGDYKGDIKSLEPNHKWRPITVPMAWEEQGNWGYDGIAWYARSFRIPLDMRDRKLYLILGRIDDFDRTYINGQFIGSTKDGRRYGHSHSFRKLRVYEIPPEVLNERGENLLLVRVEDIGNIGGIYEGPVGIIDEKRLERLNLDH